VNGPVKPGHNLQTHADCLDKKRTGLRGADILTALDLEDAAVFAAGLTRPATPGGAIIRVERSTSTVLLRLRNVIAP
jgi:hypothetical protein